MRKRYLLFGSFLLLAAVALAAIFYCDNAIDQASRDKLYSDTSAVPYNKVGLLLGTSKYLAKGGINPYYANRIQAAVDLIKSGKVKYLVVSGDNSTLQYNEPVQMQKDLMAAGVDSAVIFLDYAGFRTFDSVVRLKKVFGQQNVTIISQPFHNSRAIFIADKEGIAAIGYNARGVKGPAGMRVRLREKLARVKVFVDYLIGQEPKFLGPSVVIP